MSQFFAMSYLAADIPTVKKVSIMFERLDVESQSGADRVYIFSVELFEYRRLAYWEGVTLTFWRELN